MIYHLNPSAMDPTRAGGGTIPSSRKKEKKDTALTLVELIEKIRLTPSGSDELQEYVDELHGRIVTILSCICFGIFALPIAIQDPRRPKSGSILYIIIGLMAYFYLFAQARSLLVQGKATAIALYLPLIISIAVGYYNFYKTNHNIDSYLQFLFAKFRRAGT